MTKTLPTGFHTGAGFFYAYLIVKSWHLKTLVA